MRELTRYPEEAYSLEREPLPGFRMRSILHGWRRVQAPGIHLVQIEDWSTPPRVGPPLHSHPERHLFAPETRSHRAGVLGHHSAQHSTDFSVITHLAGSGTREVKAVPTRRDSSDSVACNRHHFKSPGFPPAAGCRTRKQVSGTTSRSTRNTGFAAVEMKRSRRAPTTSRLSSWKDSVRSCPMTTSDATADVRAISSLGNQSRIQWQ